MNKLSNPVWKLVGFLTAALIGAVLIVAALAPDANSVTRTTPPCNGKARILCGVKVPGKTVPAVPSQPRRNGPIARA